MYADDLLKELDAERQKFTRADEKRMREICDVLVGMGVYPEKSGIGMIPLGMVECYGAYWHTWSEPHACRHCGSYLRNVKEGPPFKREVGVVERDRCVEVRCPDCGKAIWVAKEKVGRS